ncbi:hypothetical protein K4F52_006378 [Lecanicillium sp. MT-2017a]|nr:hypothetical protein K4F52_006378 [Lecanicillium sp. MT-2017a]
MPPVSEKPWTSSSPVATGRQLVPIHPPLLSALAHGTLVEALCLDASITPYIVSPECTGVWKMRVAQLEREPADAIWVTRLLVLEDDDSSDGCAQGKTTVVGRAGFHGRPDDERGMVEVGYSIDPLHRRRGHARAALEILLAVARADERVTVVRASVGPWNEASRALVVGFGFVEVGEQWDEEDGREIVYELGV